jgi:hypothetical protein
LSDYQDQYIIYLNNRWSAEWKVAS